MLNKLGTIGSKNFTRLAPSFVFNTAPLYSFFKNYPVWKYNFEGKLIDRSPMIAANITGSFNKVLGFTGLVCEFASTLLTDSQSFAFNTPSGITTYQFQGLPNANLQLENAFSGIQSYMAIDFSDAKQLKVTNQQSGSGIRNLLLVDINNPKQVKEIQYAGQKATISPTQGATQAGEFVTMTATLPTLPGGTLLAEKVALNAGTMLSPEQLAFVSKMETGIPVSPRATFSCQIGRDPQDPFGVVLENISFQHDLFSTLLLKLTLFKDGTEMGSVKILVRGTGSPGGLCLPIETRIPNVRIANKSNLNVDISLDDLLKHGKAGPASTTENQPLVVFTPKKSGGSGDSGDDDDGYNYHDVEGAVEHHVRKGAWEILQEIPLGSQILQTVIERNIAFNYTWKDQVTGIEQSNKQFKVVINLNDYKAVYEQEYAKAPIMIGGPKLPETVVPLLAMLRIIKLVSQVQALATGKSPQAAEAEGLEAEKEARTQLSALPPAQKERWNIDHLDKK